MRGLIQNLSSIYIPYRILAERAKYTEFARFPKESLLAESPIGQACDSQHKKPPQTRRLIRIRTGFNFYSII